MNKLIAFILAVLSVAVAEKEFDIGKYKLLSAVKHGKVISNEQWKSVSMDVEAEVKDDGVVFKLDISAGSMMAVTLEAKLKSDQMEVTSIGESDYDYASKDLQDAQEFLNHIFENFKLLKETKKTVCFHAKSGDYVCFEEQ